MKEIKIEIRWAIIFAVMMLLWMLLERIAGLHDEHIGKHALYTNLIAVPAIVIYVLALLDKRKKYYHGYMTYKQGFLSGMVITLIVALLSPLVQVVTTTLITPGYFPNAIEYSVSQEMMTRAEAEDSYNLVSYIIQGSLGALLMGTLTSLIVALFVRKKPSGVPANGQPEIPADKVA